MTSIDVKKQKIADAGAGFENMTICSTGFKSVDLLDLTKTARLMGIIIDA